MRSAEMGFVRGRERKFVMGGREKRRKRRPASTASKQASKQQASKAS
jgi:hypothetical protein